MGSVLRLLLRFIVVPLGYLAAVITGMVVILLAAWPLGEFRPGDFGNSASGAFAFLVAMITPLVITLELLAIMWLPASIGILISEAFAIRSWIFHALNGAVAGCLGWRIFAGRDEIGSLLNQPLYVIAAGLAGGFAYWAVAGWSAGFRKPVFARPVQPLASNPFTPPAPSGT